MSNQDAILQQLLEDIHHIYGYDFRDYSLPSAWRRIHRRMTLAGLTSVSDLRLRVLRDADFADQMIKDFSINVTEMFRDPAFFAALRDQVLSMFKNLSFIKIWHAGCATGEEAYSTAIFLLEMGLYERARIYATDYNAAALHQAKSGVFPLDQMRQYIANYHNAGGTDDFARYYTAKYGSAIMNRQLKDNIVFARHDLAKDGAFSDMHLILCRNVIIYFNHELQQKVFKIFTESLDSGGYLCLGSQETMRFSEYAHHFAALNETQRIYRKLPLGGDSK